MDSEAVSLKELSKPLARLNNKKSEHTNRLSRNERGHPQTHISICDLWLPAAEGKRDEQMEYRGF